MESYLTNILGKDKYGGRMSSQNFTNEDSSNYFKSVMEKPLSSLVSKSRRDNPFIKKDTPGPGHYNIQNPKNLIDQSQTPFGSTAKRETII